MANLQARALKEPPGLRAYGSSVGLPLWEWLGSGWGGWAEHARSRSENTCSTQKMISWLRRQLGRQATVLSCN